MRYYDVTVFQNGKVFRQWSSHPNGKFDPGAHNILLDIPVLNYDIATGGQTLTIEGPRLEDLQQSQQFTDMDIVIRGGMQAGLPLANPLQAGILTAGKIFQSFGNWEGTNMTLDFVLKPSPFTLKTPGQLVLNWKAGTALNVALTQTLKTSFPDFTIVMNISPNLVLPGDVPGFYQTLEQLSAFLFDRTKGLLSPTYQGVRIAIQGTRIIVWDNDKPPPPIKINFNDMIGQPTWIAVNTMQVMFVQRADLTIGTTITMPASMLNAPGFVQQTATAMPSNVKYSNTFPGKFTITELRHIGDYRNANGQSWVTVANCVLQ